MPHLFCERCEKITQDGNRWCPFQDCPAEHGFPVFAYGDALGDLKITRLIRVWRWAALYEAERAGVKLIQTVWVKVAHAQADSQDRLRREARLLQRLRPRRAGLLPQPRALTPVLLKPFAAAGSDQIVGEVTLAGASRVFCVYEALDGSLLGDVLLEQPHLWHYEAAWITAALAEALRPLASNGLAHLAITPDVVLVQKDAAGHWRPTLLDLGWMVDASSTAANLGELGRQLEPAYSAPEVLGGNAAIKPSVDVYSLGMLYREMLLGKPGYDARLQRDDQIRSSVTLARATLPTTRPELEQAGTIKVVDKAIAQRDRFIDVQEFGRAITTIYGPIPPERRPLPVRTRLLAALTTLLAIAVIGGGVYVIARALNA